MAWRHSRRRERLTLVAIWALSSAIPIAATVKSYAASGPLWQGRYGYPYAMGFVLLCGLVLDRASSGQLQRSRAILAATGVVVGAAELIGLLHVLRHERAVSPLSGSSEWITPSTTLVVLLVAGAAGLMVLAGLDGNRRTPAAGAERSTSRLVVASTAATSQPVVVRPDRESP
jgi:hypothetical protein